MMQATPARVRRSGARLAVAAVLAGTACVQLPDFARPSEVDRPRVLAIVAEPPEVNPGAPVQLSILIAGAEDHEIEWRACGAFDGLFGGSQYGDEQDDEGCGGGFALALGDGETAMLPGTATQALFDNLDLAERILGGALPKDTLEQLRDRVGLPFTVEATVHADGKLIRAVKRVLISARATPHTNPPPPAFEIDGIEVRAIDDADPDAARDAGAASDAAFECRATSGDTIALEPEREVELAPIVDEGAEEPWLESYEVIDMRGELRDRTERAFYSWFATAGELREGVTKAPLRNEIWRTPRAHGCHRLWVVVRDGHGGASGCGLEVAVGDTTCE